jgi:hypothetical protein
MRFPVWLTALAALVGMGMMLVAGSALIRPNVPLIASAGFDDERITPNADGENDITTFRYELTRSATISITLTSDDGTTYDFRRNEPRFAQDYFMLFSGVVDGFTFDGENIPGTIERRLLPDGVYTWQLTAENDSERDERSGTLTIEAGNSDLPVMSIFQVNPPSFTPNQDGINDRVEVNVYLEKDVDTLRVYLLDDNGREYPIAERKEGRDEGEAGRHVFDYAGGVDFGTDPPPDGTYTVVGIAQDAVGQRIRRQDELTIQFGGKPRAEIVPQAVGRDVYFEVADYDQQYETTATDTGTQIAIPEGSLAPNVNMLTVPAGDMLVFRLTVDNYSDVPIRTTGPAPGTVYQQTQSANSIGAYEEPGAWRVGIECDSFLSSTKSFPYRWAIGTGDDLITIPDPDTGREFTYLPPNTQTVVWGAVRMEEIDERQNPQTCWAGLIHEAVGISVTNRFVGPIEVEIAESESNTDE